MRREIEMTRLRGLERRPDSGNAFELIRQAASNGCNMFTVGAVNGNGYANYPSKILPQNPGMDPDWLEQMVIEAERQGILLVGWTFFNIQDVRDVEDFQVAKRYPQWTMRFIPEEGKEYPSKVGMCLLSSPYAEIHLEMLREMVKAGLKVLWFDGFHLTGMPVPWRPGCVCEYCRDGFLRDYGLDLPVKVDWKDLTFRKWVRWRNEKLIGAAIRIQSELKKLQPEIALTFNYNVTDWTRGVPLWKTSVYGVSQHAFTGLQGMQWVTLGYKAKLSHDLNPEHSDIWRTSAPSFRSRTLDPVTRWPEDPEESARHDTEMKLFILGAFAYGTVPWCWYYNDRVLKDNNAELMKREAYFATAQVQHTGVLLSQNTYDFWGQTPNTEQYARYHDGVLGTWLILTENHIPFAFVFDNQLEDGYLDEMNVIILPNAVCLSARQVKNLEDWVRRGGTLVCTEDTGILDEWGEPAANTGERFRSPVVGRRAGTAEEESGSIHWIQRDPGCWYARNRDRAGVRALLDLVTTGHLPYEVEAPRDLVVNVYYGKGGSHERIIQLLNVSHFYTEKGECGFFGMKNAGKIENTGSTEAEPDILNDQLLIAYKTRTAKNVKFKWNTASIQSARTVVSGEDLPVDRDGWITVPEILLHETVIVSLKPY